MFPLFVLKTFGPRNWFDDTENQKHWIFIHFQKREISECVHSIRINLSWEKEKRSNNLTVSN